MRQSPSTLLGIDWGTSNRRAYVLSPQGDLIQRHEDAAGILHIDGNFEDSLKALLQLLQLKQVDVLMSGMVGSRDGWQQVPYLSTDQPLSCLRVWLAEIETTLPGVRSRIVPGYQYTDAHGLADVMRGEETQVLGVLELSGANGWFLLPGTHSKWALVEEGRMTRFSTFMTGELYELLSQHGTLAKLMAQRASVPEAFAAGLRAAAHGGFTHTAFCCRAMVVTGRMPAEHAASYLSGLLIGTELHELMGKAGNEIQTPIQVVGSPTLTPRYLSALELLGIQARAWPADEVYVAALRALFNLPR